MKKTLLIITALMLIVGCSQKPVEDSTLINKDGLMYLPDSDSPYSGEVFTNYSTGEKLYQGTYENGLLVQYSYLNKDGSVKEPVNMETLIDRGGNLFEINGQKPYTGEVFELYDNGNRKLSGKLKGGIKDGLFTEWYENGQKKSKGTFNDYGRRHGLWTKWYENGQKKSEGTFFFGVSNGLYTVWYENGQKDSEITYKDGEQDGLYTLWYENGQKKQEGTLKDGKIDGLSTHWYENGQKKTKGTFKDGKEDGLWTGWDENGQKEQEVSYKDGKLDGLKTDWYENGQKKFELTYKDGELISEKEWNEDGSRKENNDDKN
jgi:antitoxin component YwqK of YwqJK toxin-antitoxin module